MNQPKKGLTMKKRTVVIEAEVETSASLASLQKWLRLFVRATPLKLTERPRVNVIRRTKKG